METELPLATRELLRQLRDRFMPTSLPVLLDVLKQPPEKLPAFTAQAELVATLIDQFEREHGTL